MGISLADNWKNRAVKQGLIIIIIFFWLDGDTLTDICFAIGTVYVYVWVDES